MKRCSWLGALAAVALGTACGGVQPLEAFKDRTLVIDYSAGSMSVLLQQRSVSNCRSLSPDVVVTVNGDSGVGISPGGCSFTSSDDPLLTFKHQVTDVPQRATLVISDSTYRMEVEVEDLLAGYRFQARKPGFDPSLEFVENANPVARGEVLTFDQVPAVRTPDFEANLSQEHQSGNPPKFSWTYFDVQPAMSDGVAQVTIPADVDDGASTLVLDGTEHPAASRCEGPSACEVVVRYRIETTVTVTP